MAFGLSAADIAGIKEEQDSKNRLATPTKEQNPTFVGEGNDPRYGKWSERVIIRDTSYGPPKDRPTSETEHVFQIKLEVLGEAKGGVEKPNGGRLFNYVVYVNEPDLADQKKGFGARQRIGVLISLLQAAGADLSNGVDDWKAFFEGDKPLIGLEAVTTWHFRAWKKGEKSGENFDCLGFFSPETVA